MQSKSIEELNQLYEEADSIDKEIFAEQRSNVLLISGEHYSRRMMDHFARLRNTKDQALDQKLRLTKNHTYRTVRHYVSNILDYAPGASVVPNRDDEILDQKMAEQYQAVWENHFKIQYRMDEVVREAAQDFCGVGEVCYLIKYDPNQGKVVGYSPLMDESGQPALDHMMQMQPDHEKPVMEGKFVFDRLFAANVLRHPAAKSMRTSPCLIVRYMADVKDLKSRYADHPDKLKFITESSEQDFIVFDTNKYSYSHTKDQCLMMEHYYRPCMEYPEGYFYIATKGGILEEGPLPFGIFPVIWQGFDEYVTSPRGRSIVKVVRPYQAEINRAASSAAMQQVTLGDDKVIYQAGTKLAPGALLPGVRGFTYQGMAPTILPGRDGSQFTEYINNNIAELDRASMVNEIDAEKDNGVTDPMTALFQTVAQKKRFSIYIQKFEQFLIDFTYTTLLFAREYLTDQQIITAIGKADQINLSDFKTAGNLLNFIRVVPREDTMETQLGKQVMITHALQYVGGQLQREDIGNLLQNLPYGNFKDTFSDLTMDSQNVKSDILALEKGIMPRVGPNDNNEYYVKVLSNRMKRKDFYYLPQVVQQNFDQFNQMHEKEISRKADAIKAAESEFIPSSGAMIACDMYVPNEADPTKAPKRIRVPYDALNWLLQKMTAQGNSQDKLESIGNQCALAQIAQMSQPGPSVSQGVGQNTINHVNGQGLGQGMVS